jgi:hypothetical protein
VGALRILANLAPQRNFAIQKLFLREAKFAGLRCPIFGAVDGKKELRDVLHNLFAGTRCRKIPS